MCVIPRSLPVLIPKRGHLSSVSVFGFFDLVFLFIFSLILLSIDSRFVLVLLPTARLEAKFDAGETATDWHEGPIIKGPSVEPGLELNDREHVHHQYTVDKGNDPSTHRS